MAKTKEAVARFEIAVGKVVVQPGQTFEAETSLVNQLMADGFALEVGALLPVTATALDTSELEAALAEATARAEAAEALLAEATKPVVEKAP